MKFGTPSLLVAAAAIVVGVGFARNPVESAGEEKTLQLAVSSPADAIAKRQEVMKGIGAHMKAINEFVESGTGSAEDVGTRAGEIKERSGGIAELFPAGTSIDDDVAKTAAKKEIWDNLAEFKAGVVKMGDLAGALQEAAATGDTQKITEAFGMLGKEGCGSCHSKYRLKTP